MAPPRDDLASALQLSTVTTGELSPAERAEIVDLCTRAFNEDFSSLFFFVDSGDHVLARLEGRLVGHAVWGTRWLQPEGGAPLRTAYVDAVASDPGLWSRGVGSAVMRRLAEETAGYQLRGLSTDRPAFYQRLGWERWMGPRGVRTEDGVALTPDEIVMISCTPITPPLDRRSRLTVEPRPGQPW